MAAVDLGTLTGAWRGRARLWFEADVLAPAVQLDLERDH